MTQQKWRKCIKKPLVVDFREVNGDEEIIHTREGNLKAYKDQDFIIRGIAGEEYPIKKSIFYQSYEALS